MRPPQQIQGEEREQDRMGKSKGEAVSGEVYPFGTPVMFRISGPVQGGVMRERWFD